MSARVSRHGAFDSAHDWTGDELTASETAAFQEGKAKALEKLLPYAHLASRHEAAAVVLELDGSEFGFWIGEKYSVETMVPANRFCAHLHTHPAPEPQSQDDWPEFLFTTSVLQSHVVAPNATYSLHKPMGWTLPPELNSKRAIAEAFYGAYERAQYDAFCRGEHLSDVELDERATQNMAIRCAIIFRIGKRKKV